MRFFLHSRPVAFISRKIRMAGYSAKTQRKMREMREASCLDQEFSAARRPKLRGWGKKFMARGRGSAKTFRPGYGHCPKKTDRGGRVGNGADYSFRPHTKCVPKCVCGICVVGTKMRSRCCFFAVFPGIYVVSHYATLGAGRRRSRGCRRARCSFIKLFISF